MTHKKKLIDGFGRKIHHLRISLTEHCNFRCVYCMPAEGVPTLNDSKHLTIEEIVRFVRIAGLLGITHVRLTGGEPLLRKDILDIVRGLKTVDTVTNLSLTTNASRLTPLLKPLKDAGLDRINISLDSVYPDRFERVTLTGFYHEVFHTVFNTLEAGFPVKLNMVVLRGLTDKEIVDFVSLADQYPLEVRFLEFMPLCGTGWKKEEFLPIKDVRSVVMEHFDLTETPREGHAAQSFLIKNGRGRVGFIASLTESFCTDCSRIRLSCDGRILPCLFSDRQVSVKDLLKQKAPDEDITSAIQEAAKIKPAGNQFLDRPFEIIYDKEQVLAKTPYIRKIGG